MFTNAAVAVASPRGADSSAVSQAAGWRGSLRLAFGRTETRTVIRERRHEGPLLVQRPFYPEGAVCHAYVLHPPSGVVGGDRLSLDVAIHERAEALLTTPAATKIYRSPGPVSELEQRFRVESGAALEWLPQETIVFDGARAVASTRVDLEDTARFFGWEVTCLGRRAAGERFERGSFRQRLEIRRGGTPLLLEHLKLEGGGATLTARWGLAGFSVTGTLAAVLPPPLPVRELREATASLSAGGADWFAVTALEHAIVCRYLGHGAERARALFLECWNVLRPRLLGRAPCPPRIWAT